MVAGEDQEEDEEEVGIDEPPTKKAKVTFLCKNVIQQKTYKNYCFSIFFVRFLIVSNYVFANFKIFSEVQKAVEK